MVMALSERDFMERALQIAERGRGRTSPNPMVGAVIVSDDGAVIGTGFHARAGEPHAEVHALDAAGERARGATLYCTLEPCCHTGRTGPCVERIVHAGIVRVVAAVADPNPLVAGGGFQFLQEHGVRVDVGLCREEAILLNRAFWVHIQEHRPFVIMKVATSLDGCIAAAGSRTPLTSTATRRRVHAIRAEVDAVAVGSGTILIDDPLLTVRETFRPRPLTRVVLDRRLRTPPTAKIFSTLDQGPVVILTTHAALDARPAEARALREAGARLDVPAGSGIVEAIRHLGNEGVTSLLLEGGAAVHAAAWDAGVVDYAEVHVAPTVLGRDGVRWLPGRSLSTASWFRGSVEPCGPDVLMTGYVHRIG
jgi:diaminohydroxyphosphoribosylaminopyrimidine deaminase/5-amino-6-(5-phosphoribosylamino)uracil reductase